MSSDPQPTPAISAAAPAPPPPKKRSIVYIDGFNFYYGMLADRPDLKWINYQRLAELLRPDDDIVHVRLFTAMVDKKKAVSAKRDRQQRLWAALKTQPKITLTEGKFANRERTCLVPTCHNPERKFVALEEKQTDVNLALHLVQDVQTLVPDFVVIISGDIDLLPALDLAMKLNKKVRPSVFIPVPEEILKYRRKDEFMHYAPAVKPIPEKYLRQAQFPSRVQLANGQCVERPLEWPAGGEQRDGN